MKKYPTYKESGIQWIGEIPEHWELKCLKFWVKLRNEKVSNTSPLDFKVALENIEKETGKLILENGSFEGFGNAFKAGDILFNKLRPYLTKVYEAEREGVAVSELLVLEPQNCVGAFLKYRLLSKDFIDIVDSSTYGAKMPRANWNFIGNINLPYPPYHEQTFVATFLDQKTSEIDQLIAAKAELIQKLEAQRKAIINEAVTGQAFKTGMIPAPDGKQVMYKDSGVKWLGEIPEHWSVQKFRYSINVLTDYTANGSFASLAENVEYLESGYSRLVRLTDLRLNLENDGIYVSEKSHRFLKKSELYGEEILLANVGAYSGLAWKVPHIDFPATLGPNMFLLKFKESFSNDFAYYSLVSDYLSNQLKNKAISSAQPKLNKEDVRSCMIVKPPFEEQIIIVQYLFEKLKEYNLLIEIENQSISKLKQYKQSLISEAVTGKIDVREWQKDETNKIKNL